MLLVVGGALVYAFYGPGALLSALLCIGLGLAPVALAILAIAGMDLLRKWADRS